MNINNHSYARPGRRWLVATVGFLIGTMSLSSAIADERPARASTARVPLLSSEDAWKRLPPVESGGGGALPSWARALAGSLPYTTAATLELDRIYRTSDALEPRLAASIRLIVARTLRSEYGMAYAESDLRRAGMDQAAIERLKADSSALAGPERAVLSFAARMTTAGYTTTDDEVAALVASFGEARVVAIVLQIAYANFLDRMALALGLTVEPDGPVAPIDVRFAKPGESGIQPANRPALPASAKDPVVTTATDPDWKQFNFGQLQEKLEAQRDRKPRVSIPTWEEFRAALPEGLYPRSKPLRIRWSLLVSGRQPRLGPAWIKCLRIFEEEARQDRVFEESLFWVVTRSLRCFYCMGHCEMLLEDAGLDRKAIAGRTAKLAGDDWSSFPPNERTAFEFARKLTRTPWDVDDDDIRQLRESFGPERMLDVIWWSSRCQFMTKVSDAFQLQLERENVFKEHLSPDEGPK
jgi:alkylhydroperoxidase family enzyme